MRKQILSIFLSVCMVLTVAVDSGTPEEPVQDSGNQERNPVPDNLTVATTGSAIETETTGQQEPPAPEWEETTVDIPVTWTAEPEYDGNENGDYVFTPAIEGYTVCADLLEITVMVGAQPFMMALRGGAPLPTAAYAEAPMAAAVSGTDYVLDDTNKVLTIKTAKGAARWSAHGSSYLDYEVKLVANIDVSALLWTPVGNGGTPFTGSFDGQGHSISGLTITAANESCAGLFGGTQSATIRNLCVSGTINVTESSVLYIGGIVGWLYDSSTIRNCCSHVDISATADEVNAGGIAGWLVSGTIENCFNTGNVSGAGVVMAGGICGTIGDTYSNSKIGIVKNSYNTGRVTGSGSITQLGALGGCVFGKLVLENYYYLSGTASAALGFGSSANSSLFMAGEANTLLAALNGWVATTDSADYYTWIADNLSDPINGGYPMFGAAWGTETGKRRISRLRYRGLRIHLFRLVRRAKW